MDRLVRLGKRTVSGDPSPAIKRGDGGYADWVIVVIHGLRKYLNLPYRRPLNVLHEMYSVVEKVGPETSELPDFTTVCVRKQQFKMAVGGPLRLSADLHNTEYRLSTQLSSTATQLAVTMQTGQTTPSGRQRQQRW